MIIKLLSRKGNKSNTVKQLLSYILQEHKQGDFLLLHNMTGNSIKEYTNAIMHNEKNRLYIRSNVVLVFHEIISVHHYDNKHLSQQKLRAIAKRYIKERCPHALVVAVPHYDKQSIHLHLVISGINLNGRSSRISKERLHEIKITLQQAFPELEHSIVEHGKKQRYISEKEFQLKKRKVITEKEQIQILLESLYKTALSKDDFLKRIHDGGLQIYERNNKPNGIITKKRKLRFTTLGFDAYRLEQLNTIQEFEKIRNKRNRKMTIER